MKRLLVASLIGASLILSVGCAKKEEAVNTQTETSQEVGSQETQSELEEVDSDYVESVMKKVKDIDSELPKLENKVITIESEKEGHDPQDIIVWSQEGRIVKATKSQPDDLGRMEGMSSYYYENGKIIYISHPFSNHVFKEWKMVSWMDENMNVLEDIPKGDIENAEKAAIEENKEIMGRFEKSASTRKIWMMDSIDPSKLSYTVSEMKRDKALEEAIAKELDYDKKSYGPIRYYYKNIDLNDDGNREVFAYLVGSYVSGSGGSSAIVFERDGEEYKALSRFSLVRNPIIISDSKTNGYRDIIMSVSGGGVEQFYSHIKFDGKTYPGNPSVQEEVSSDSISGTAIISEDISDYMGIEMN